MVAHIILCICLVISILAFIFWSIFQLSLDIDWLGEFSSVSIVVFLVMGCLTGMLAHNAHNFRRDVAPKMEDVNNGYAEMHTKIITEITEYGSHSYTVYYCKWIGTNKVGERELNNIEDTYLYKHNKIK